MLLTLEPGDGEASMKDMQVHLEKLRQQVAECELIRDLATAKPKRELFDRLAAHLKVLADQVEREMLATGAGDAFLGDKTQEEKLSSGRRLE
jgi:hypothetical protein